MADSPMDRVLEQVSRAIREEFSEKDHTNEEEYREMLDAAECEKDALQRRLATVTTVCRNAEEKARRLETDLMVARNHNLASEELKEAHEENAILTRELRRSSDDIGNLTAKIELLNGRLQQTPGAQALQERLNRSETEISRLRVALEKETRLRHEQTVSYEVVAEERDMARANLQRLGSAQAVTGLEFIADYTFEPPQGLQACIPWPFGHYETDPPARVVLRMFATPAKKVSDDI